jgi:hypothetical protein
MFESCHPDHSSLPRCLILPLALFGFCPASAILAPISSGAPHGQNYSDHCSGYGCLLDVA